MNEMRPSSLQLPQPPPRSAKLKPWHLDRVAVVYVRQSSQQQVLDHRESTARQYALHDRARELGWGADRIVTVDEDQGQSGRSAEGRPGFQRLLAEVAFDRVGLILGLEMSRLARSCKDWHHLLELCARYRTLLGDAEALYDPCDFNDRLLLGLKGSMSEAELHILKERMHQGVLNKARRGELFNHAPIGYVRSPTGEMALDPDEQVQAVVRLTFDEFEARGTLTGLLARLVRLGIKLPVRPHHGGNRGRLEWRRPTRATLQNLLHHPLYAGAYCYGRRPTDARKQKPGRPATGREVRRPEECAVLLRGRCPAYISWDRFLANQRRLDENGRKGAWIGSPRNGPSLLAGLIYCGRCGRRMLVQYSGAHLRYACSRAAIDYGEPQCQNLAGRVLDELVAARVLAAVEPAALEASLAAVAEVERTAAQLTQHWRQRLERAACAVERAAKQHGLVEPENRLVARELERRWEEALRESNQLENEYADFRRSGPKTPDAAEIESIRALAADMPALWRAPTTSPADRQKLVRLLVKKTTVAVLGASDLVQLTIVWQGGGTEQHELRRPVDGYAQLMEYPALAARARELHAAGRSAALIATALNGEGFRPPKRTATFTAGVVHGLLRRLGVTSPAARPAADATLGPDEWSTAELAARLAMPLETMIRWRIVGWVRSRRSADSRRQWILWADADELDRLTKLRSHPRTWAERAEFLTLQRPKARSETSTTT